MPVKFYHFSQKLELPFPNNMNQFLSANSYLTKSFPHKRYKLWAYFNEYRHQWHPFCMRIQLEHTVCCMLRLNVKRAPVMSMVI